NLAHPSCHAPPNSSSSSLKLLAHSLNSHLPFMHIEHHTLFCPIPGADVEGVNMLDLRFGRKMAVAAEQRADIGILQEQLADFGSAQIRLGKIPLRVVRWRQQLRKRKMMNRRDYLPIPHALQLPPQIT